MEVEQTGVRRLCAFVDGLPPDAAVWREDLPTWTNQDELAAINAETVDRWGRKLAGLMWVLRTGKAPPEWLVPKKPLDIQHTGRPKAQQAKPKVTSDPNQIKKFLSRIGGR